VTPGHRACLECGGEYRAQRSIHRFCTPVCRDRFHRRRRKRGAALYDLVMVWRFDRTGEGPQAHMLLCRHASDFRELDKAENRARSWMTVAELREDGALAMVSSVSSTTKVGRM
jgi:hypothetical protein